MILAHIAIFFNPDGLNNGFGLKFHVGYQVRHKTPEEGCWSYQLKCFEYNNKDEDNSLNTLNDKNYLASSQKLWQIIYCNFLMKYYKMDKMRISKI